MLTNLDIYLLLPRVLHISCRQFVSWVLWLWSLCCAREETLLSRSLQTTEQRLNTEEPSTWQIRAWWKFKRFQIFEQNLKLSKLRLLPHFMIRRTRKIGDSWIKYLYSVSKCIMYLITFEVFVLFLGREFRVWVELCPVWPLGCNLGCNLQSNGRQRIVHLTTCKRRYCR